MQSEPRHPGTTKRTPVVVRSSNGAGVASGLHASEAGPTARPIVAGSGAIPIVLVGRTNLEGVLRLDPSFEVYRTTDGPAALGQVSQLSLTQGTCPLVVVSPDSDPATRETAFRDALAMVNVTARIVQITSVNGANGSGGTSASGTLELSTRLSPGATREALRRFAASTESSETNTAAERVVEALMRQAPPTPAEPIDTPMLQAMLCGRDVLLAAMQVIRRAIGTIDVYFDEAKAMGEGSPLIDEKRRVSVRHASREYGHLVSVGVCEEVLGSWAEWLAHWLALREQQEQLRTAALVDELTGAWNRRYFDGFLSAAMKHAHEHGHSVTVLYFDIDNFKRYNDAYGHGAGDEILRETVGLLQSVIRPTDRVCRIGGDEFGVIFHEPQGPREPSSTPPASIREIAQRFQRQVSEHRFPKLGELAPGTLTISGGLASFPQDAATAEELVNRADELAMQSKREGKNVMRYGPGAERVCGEK